MFDVKEARRLYVKIKRGSFTEEELRQYQAMKADPAYQKNIQYIEG